MREIETADRVQGWRGHERHSERGWWFLTFESDLTVVLKKRRDGR